MTDRPMTELQSFHQFVSRHLKSGTNLTPEEALTLWREEQNSMLAIRAGLADVDAGRTMSIDDFDRDFRKRHGIK